MEPFKIKLIRFIGFNFVVSLIIYFIGRAAEHKDLNTIDLKFFIQIFLAMIVLTGIYEIVRKVLDPLFRITQKSENSHEKEEK